MKTSSKNNTKPYVSSKEESSATASEFSEQFLNINENLTGHLVIIDDDEEVTEALDMILSTQGFKVTRFNLPIDAMKFIVENEIDLVFTDVKMPRMSGVEVLKAIRKIDSQLPVTFVTGQCSKEDLIEAVNLGVFSVVEKPWRNEIIVDTAVKALQLRRLNALATSAVHIIMSQYFEFDKFLKDSNRESDRLQLKPDVFDLLEKRKFLRKIAA